MPERILFLTLKIFSVTGGIEKVCRIAGKALSELNSNGLKIFCLHDSQKSADNKYFTADIFEGFAGKKFNFLFSSLQQGFNSDTIILSHINLLSVGWLIKRLSSKKKLVLFVHGIEVWKPLPGWKLKMLNKCDLILAVSSYTKEKIILVNKIREDKCSVLNNCLDPFLPSPNPGNVSQLCKVYNFTKNDFILLTVTRIDASEKYKGHEKIIEALSMLTIRFPQLKYLIVGKYDASEKERLDKLVEEYNLKDKIVFSGFVTEAELADHYTLSDVYIMPSVGEGFGIVFIEAMFYGLPVIAGNKDGSLDAVCNGQLGLAINPEDQKDICNAIAKIIGNKTKFIPNRNVLMQNFSYPVYKERLNDQLQNLCN